MGRVHDDVQRAYFSRNPKQRDLVKPFLNGFDVTFAERWGDQRGTVVAIYLKPETAMAEFLGLEREMLLVYSPFKEFQARALELHDALLEIQRTRLDPALSVIVSDDPSVSHRLSGFLAADREHPPVLALSVKELAAIKDMDALRAALVGQFMRRDVFALDSPLTRDTMFFGRQGIVNTLVDQFRIGQNAGLFGLRRMGKTSVLYALERRIESGGLGIVTYVDLSNPAFYRSRWWRLLEHLVRAVAAELPEDAVTRIRLRAIGKSYSEAEAAQHFHNDIRTLAGVAPGRRLLLALDEVENVTLGVSSAAHWEQDFLPFWQTLRSLHQVSKGQFCFITSGVNPRALEIERIGFTDNPLFATLNTYYLEPFTQPEVREMVRRLGRFMGLRVEEALIPALTEEYGGHPYLIRQACSRLASQLKTRPETLTYAKFARERERLRVTLEKNASQIMSVLAIWDSNEYERLVELAHGDKAGFMAAAERSAKFTEHVEGYGVVANARSDPRIRVLLIREYLAKVTPPAKTPPAPADDVEGVLAELSRRRNAIEIALRRVLESGLVFKHGDKAAARTLDVLPQQRREQLQGAGYEAIWEKLYFDELRSILDRNWEAFQAYFQEEKATVLGWMEHINRCRADAHARSLKPDDLAYVRTCFTRLEEKVRLG